MSRFNVKTPRKVPWAIKANMGLLLATVVVILIHTYMMLQSQRFHHLLIDVSGRQRMLHQKYFKEILLTSKGITSDFSGTHRLLRQGLEVLLHGGSNPFIEQAGTEKILPPAPTKPIVRAIQKQIALLEQISGKAAVYLESLRTGPEDSEILEILLSLNRDALVAAEQAVRLYRLDARTRFDRQMAGEALIAILLLGLWALLARQVMKAREEAEYEIVERKHAEEALRETDQRLSLTLQGLHDGLWDRPDLTQDEEWWSPRYYELLGYHYGEIPASFSAFLAFLHPDDKPLVEEAVRKHLDKHVPYDLEYRLRTKSGEYRWFRSRAMATWDQGGRPVRLSGSLLDITEQKFSRQALQESEERLRAIIESTPDVIFVKDVNGRYVMANHTTAKVLGRSVEEILGKRDDELFEATSAERIMEIDRRVLDAEKVESTEDLLTIDGQDRWYSSIKVPFHDSHGKVQGLVGIVRDITEKKLSEFALRKSEQWFRNLVAASKDPIFYVGKDHSILYVSPVVQKVFGYAPKEWTGELFARIVHPSSQETFEYVWNYFDEYGTFTEEPLEISWIRKDGSDLHTDLRFANLYDEHGEVSGFLVIARDISEKKLSEWALRQSEERFRTLVAASKDPIFFVGTDGELIYGSPAVETVFGYPLSEWTRDRILRYVHPDSLQDFKQFWNYFEEHGIFSEDSLEITWIKKDGTFLYCDQRYTNVFNQEGKVIGFMTISRDITDRKQTEAALLKSQEEVIQALRQSDSMKSALLSSVSHEIRTPLAAMKAMVDSSLVGPGETAVSIRREFLDSINQEIEYLDRIVDNLLDMSRLESGEVEPTREWFLVEDLIEGAIRRLGKAFEQRSLDLALDDTVPPLFVDGIEIQQVLVNLLDNAVKYSTKDAIIRLEAVHQADSVEIRISNPGVSIIEEEKARLFERFYRSTSTITRRTRGTGLGLAICKGIIEAHGGKIWIENEPVGLVRVTFQLPAGPRLFQNVSLIPGKRECL